MAIRRELKFLSGLLSLIILTAGLIAVYRLAQTPQDIRQQAANDDVIFSDSFENNLANWIINNGTDVSISSDRSQGGNKSLKIRHGINNWGSSVEHPLSQASTGIVSVYFYDDAQALPSDQQVFLAVSDLAKTKGVSLRILPSLSSTNYSYCPTTIDSECIDTKYARTAGWHRFEIHVTPKGSYGKIDSQNMSALIPAVITAPTVNYNLTTIQNVGIVVMGPAVPDKYYYFDTFTFNGPYDSPPSDLVLAQNYIDLYLNSYNNINLSQVDQLIKARETDFCTSDTQPCPDGSDKRPHWHYNEQLFHFYNALIETGGAHAIKYLRTTPPNPDDLTKAIAIITYINNEYARWANNKSGALVGSLLSQTSWMIWDQLPSITRDSIRSHLYNNTNYFINQYAPYSDHIGNSAGEENQWPAMYLDRVSLMFHSDPTVVPWYERAKVFAFHTLTKNESYGGYTTQTIYNDNNFDNHGYHPHPGYGTSTPGNNAALNFMRKNITNLSTDQYIHNVLPVYQKMQEYIDYRTFYYKGSKIIKVDGGENKFLTGFDDWGGNALNMVYYRTMKSEYPATNTYTDPDTGLTFNDLSRHANDYLFYTRRDYLAYPKAGNIQFTEMMVDNDWIYQQDGWNRYESYQWVSNAGAVWEKIMYLVYFDPNFSLPDTSQIPNCSNISGPNTVVQNTPGTFSANYYSAEGNLGMGLFYDNLESTGFQVNPIGTDWTWVTPAPQQSGTITNRPWTPTIAGTYNVCCRALHQSTAECRPATYVDPLPGNQYACTGPSVCKSVSVITPTPRPPSPTPTRTPTPSRTPTPTLPPATITPIPPPNPYDYDSDLDVDFLDLYHFLLHQPPNPIQVFNRLVSNI